MKLFSEAQVDDIIRLKFGRLVTELQHRSYVPDSTLAKIFKVSASTIRRQYTNRFEKIRVSKLPLLERLRLAAKQEPRKNFGKRFLKSHQITWLTSARTLRQQTAMTLVDRCKQFRQEFPGASTREKQQVHP